MGVLDRGPFKCPLILIIWLLSGIQITNSVNLVLSFFKSPIQSILMKHISVISVLFLLLHSCLTLPLISQIQSLSSYLPNYVQGHLGLDEDVILKTGPDDYQTFKESDKLRLKRNGINFIDVTNFPFFTTKEKVEVPTYKYPKKTKHNTEVNKLIQNIDTTKLHSNLANFTSFYTRYYKSQSGLESALWLLGTINEIIYPRFDVIEVETVDHKKWDQFSIIVSIPGRNSTKEDKGNIIVIGSHQDSTNLLFPNLLKAPGADDNGSGTVTVLEALRILVESNFTPENTVEFHFYSAEEGGLLGSLDVFTTYAFTNQKVVAMLQQDMTGYVQRSLDNGVPEHMGLITDHTSEPLNNFIKVVIDDYCLIPYHESKCGYACSDHASATENGFPASFVIESEMSLANNYIHSVMDTLDRLSFEHMAEHVKLTLGFAYELGMTQTF